MLRVKIEENDLKVPIVAFRLGNGSVHKALIDTGSMISIFDENLPTEIQKQSTIEVSTLNGTKEQKVTKAKLTVIFDGKGEGDIELAGRVVILEGIKMNLKEIITDVDVDAIIGSESLCQMNAIIDMDKNILEL